jgi:hypothetical protein
MLSEVAVWLAADGWSNANYQPDSKHDLPYSSRTSHANDRITAFAA